MGRLDPGEADTAVEAFRRQWPALHRLPITEALVERAGRLAWTFGLRGFGSNWPQPSSGGSFSPLHGPLHRLYDLLALEDSDPAHTRYNALLRRLISFDRAAGASSPLETEF